MALQAHGNACQKRTAGKYPKFMALGDFESRLELLKERTRDGWYFWQTTGYEALAATVDIVYNYKVSGGDPQTIQRMLQNITPLMETLQKRHSTSFFRDRDGLIKIRYAVDMCKAISSMVVAELALASKKSAPLPYVSSPCEPPPYEFAVPPPHDEPTCEPYNLRTRRAKKT